MRLLFSIIFLLVTFISKAQTIQQDESNIKKNIQLGDAAKISKEYAKAASYYQLGVAISKKYKTAFIDELIICNSNLAFSQYMVGNIKEASETYRSNLINIEKRFGKNSQIFAFDLYFLAGCESALNHYYLAIELYEEAKGIFKVTDGAEDRNYANCFLQQALNYNYFPDKQNKLKSVQNFEFYLN